MPPRPRKPLTRSAEVKSPTAVATAVPLTQSERDVCQQIVVFGVEYLRTVQNWPPEQIDSFLRRPEVQLEYAALKKQFEDRTGIQERTQFFAQLKVNSMVPAAINTLAKALRGPYTNPGDGQPVAPPSRGQFEAAMQILDRSNIQGQKWGQSDTTPNIDARSVNVAIHGEGAGKGHDLSAESRERVRRLVALVQRKAGAAADAHDIAAERAKTVGSEQPVHGEDSDG